MAAPNSICCADASSSQRDPPNSAKSHRKGGGSGLDSALLRFVPSYARLESWGAIVAVIRYAETMTLLTGAAIALCGVLMAWTAGIQSGDARVQAT